MSENSLFHNFVNNEAEQKFVEYLRGRCITNGDFAIKTIKECVRILDSLRFEERCHAGSAEAALAMSLFNEFTNDKEEIANNKEGIKARISEFRKIACLNWDWLFNDNIKNNKDNNNVQLLEKEE